MAGTQSKTKSILWTDAGGHAFKILKDMVNVWQKLDYIDYQSDTILCTDESDYAIGAYLYQKAKNGSLAKYLRLYKVDGRPSKRRPMQCIMLYKS